MKIKLDKPIENLNGTPIDGLNMAKVLADRLAGLTEGGSKIKSIIWAMSLWKTGEMEIDVDDFIWMIGWIKENKTVNALMGGQILLEMERQKEIKA